jgi:predicted outer membrane repeat protein
MKKTGLGLAVIAFCSMCAMVTAQTNVSGPVTANTNWTLAGSPYIVVGNTLVQEGITLTIAAGVTVKFNDQMALQVDGELIAIGNINTLITFTSAKPSPEPDDWDYISFSNTSADAVFDGNGQYVSGSIIEYCIVQYAGGGDYTFGAIVADNALPFIHCCTIQHNGASGIYASNIPGTLMIKNNTITDNAGDTGGGINAWGGYVIIEQNTIVGNSALGSYGGGGIFAMENTTYIFNNVISDNQAIGYAAGGGGGGVYIRQGTSTISRNIIRNNTLTNLEDGEGGGILDYYGGVVNIYGNVITNNSSGKGGGIFGGHSIANNCISENSAGTRGGGIYMAENSVTNNSLVYNNANIGSAIDIYLADDPYEFTYNTITGNTASGGEPGYSMGISAHPIIHFNNISGNTATYELYNNNDPLSGHLDAKENWWGTTSTTEIQGLIYDWIDDATKGIVDYSPFANSIRTDAPMAPPSGLTVVEGTGEISLSWNANAEPDLAGYKVYWGSIPGYPYEHTADAGNVTSYTITGLSGGNYFATVTAYDSSADTVTDDPGTIVNEIQCAGNESWYSKAVSNLGIDDLTMTGDTRVAAYPNPSSGDLILQVPSSTSEVKIINSFGQLIRETSIKDQSNLNFHLDKAGTYIIQVKTGDQVITRKIIIL